jgi:hypothetical protein
MARILNRFAFLIVLLLGISVAQAGELAAPTGKVILTVTGKVKNTNGDGVSRFDRAMLESLGVVTLRTSTHWTEGVVEFEGIPARRLLEAVGAEGKTMKALAINDYAVEIPVSDFLDNGVLLALKMDGKYMRVRDKGPIWIVYPIDQNPELDTKAIRDRWIWQLKRLDIQ